MLFDGFVITIGFIYFYYHQGLLLTSWQFQKEVAVQLLKDSWPLILSGLVISIYMRIDQVMIKEMLDSDAVGQYSAAVRLSEVWYFIPMAIASSLFPAIINAKKQSEALYYERLQKLYDMMAWMAIAIALPMTFLSDWIIHLLYGEAYADAGKVLMIHIWAGVFVFLGVASSKWFVTENLQKYSFYRTLAGAVINIALNYILIPIYSIYGAAFATLISQAIASYLYNATNKKILITFKLQTNALFLPLRKLGVKFG
jgi:O-antigen/teichoic acid export membrane protein